MGGLNVSTMVYHDSVGRATGWESDNSQQGQETFTSSKHPDQLYGPHSLLLNTYRLGGGLSLWIKRPGPEADNSLPTSTTVKNQCSHISTPVCLHAVHTDNIYWCLGCNDVSQLNSDVSEKGAAHFQGLNVPLTMAATRCSETHQIPDDVTNLNMPIRN